MFCCPSELRSALRSKLYTSIIICAGAESDRDESFVRALCAKLDVALHIGNGDVRARAAKRHESVEEAARALRYAFFASLPGLIATAHTQDDNLETVFLNLTRGTGLAGLCGIPPKRKSFIRPMLAVSRTEIEAYLEQNGLSHVTDSTNFLPDARRNRLRQSVIPLLKAENPSLCETAFRMCRLLEADEAQLSAQAKVVLQQARLAGWRSVQHSCRVSAGRSHTRRQAAS